MAVWSKKGWWTRVCFRLWLTHGCSVPWVWLCLLHSVWNKKAAVAKILIPTLLTGWHHIGHISNVVNKWNRARNQCYTDHYSKHVYGPYNPKISIDLVKNVPCPLIHVYAAGSNLPQYPAAGPFTQLIYKNISVPVYTTLKGVSEIFFAFSHLLNFVRFGW